MGRRRLCHYNQGCSRAQQVNARQLIEVVSFFCSRRPPVRHSKFLCAEGCGIIFALQKPPKSKCNPYQWICSIVFVLDLLASCLLQHHQHLRWRKVLYWCSCHLLVWAVLTRQPLSPLKEHLARNPPPRPSRPNALPHSFCQLARALELLASIHLFAGNAMLARLC